MSTATTGELLEVDGRTAVRFERVYQHPIEDVWEAVSEPSVISEWFPSSMDYEPVVGSEIVFSGDPNALRTTGKLLEYEPPNRLVFAWGPDELRFELESVDGGATRFTLTNVLDEGIAAARNGAGWEVCLSRLDTKLGTKDGEVEWRPHYDAYIEAGFPHGAWLPSDRSEG